MSISFVASSRGPTSFPGAANNTSSVACAKPTGTVDGDLMVAYCQSGLVVHSPPAGWTLYSAYQDTTNSLTGTIYYKFASSEGSSYTFTDDGGGLTPMSVQILTYRGVANVGTINAGGNSQTGSNAQAAPTVTSTALGRYVWFRAGKTATVASEGDFTLSGGTARQKSSNRGNSTQYFVESADSNGALSVGSHTGATFTSSVTLAGSLERTIVLTEAPQGSSAMTLGGVSQAFAGSTVAPTSGTVDMPLSGVSMDFAGTPTPPAGPIDLQLSQVSMSLAASSAVGGGLSMSLSPVSMDSAVTVNPTGTIDLTLSPIVMTSTLETTPKGQNVIVVEEQWRTFIVIDEDPGLILVPQEKLTYREINLDYQLPQVVMDFEGEGAHLYATLDTVLPQVTMDFAAAQILGTLSTTLSPVTMFFAQEDLMKYVTSIGDGTNASYTVTHNAGTKDVAVVVYDNTTGEEVVPLVTRTTTNAATVQFTSAPATNAYRVLVLWSLL